MAAHKKVGVTKPLSVLALFVLYEAQRLTRRGAV